VEYLDLVLERVCLIVKADAVMIAFAISASLPRHLEEENDYARGLVCSDHTQQP
jgi:hypothetical protein